MCERTAVFFMLKKMVRLHAVYQAF